MAIRLIRLSALLRHGLLGVSLSLLPCLPASAQKSIPRAEYYSIDDGLSDRLINDIIQDELGFTWIATPNGLNRFDGYQFITYNNHPDNEFTISGTSVQRIEQDNRGNLVLLYQNNKVFFDLFSPKTNEYTKVRLTLEDGITGFVRTIYVNPQGLIYVLSVHENGTHLYRYLPGEEQYLQLLFRIPEVHASVSASIDMVQLSDGSFLINDEELGLRLFNGNGALLKSFEMEDFDCLDDISQYPCSAQFMHQDKNRSVWLSFSQIPGVFRYNPSRQHFEQVNGLPAEGNYSHIWEDEAGNVLLSQSEYSSSYSDVIQLYCIKKDSSVFDFSYLTSISPRILSAYAQDFFKTIFLAIETGLSIVQNNRSKIRNYLAQNLDEYRRGNVMRGIAGDNTGTVYFASEREHWYALDLTTNTLDTLHLIDQSSGRPIQLNRSYDIQLDGQGHLWGFTRTRFGKGKLIKLHLEQCTASTYLFDYPFTSFVRGFDGKLWLTSQPQNEKGLLVSFDPKTEDFDVYLDHDQKNPLKNSAPYYIMEGRDSLLWIGTDDGLFCIDRRTTRIQNYRFQPNNQSIGLSSNTIYVIHQDNNGLLWLGTNNGINILDPETGIVRTIDKRDGLASNTVCGILPDKKGNYWISTFNGLSYYEPKRKQFRSFYAEDGFSHDEFNRFSFYRDKRGLYFFGGVNGMNVFDPDDLLINDPPRPVVFTRLTRYNSKEGATISKCSPLCGPEEVIISPHDIYFQFDFMLPNYSSPRKNQFMAWLEGYEDSTIYLGNTHNVRYSRLPAGHYTLHLRGADPNGNWSETRSVNLVVKPIFYRTWWFLMLSVLLIVSLIYWVLKSRLEQKLKVERLRTRLSSDLHDEVSGLLSGIAMQTDVLQEFVQDEFSRKKLKTIGEKSRKAMSKMSDVIWSIDSRNDRLGDLILRMHEHAEEILAPLSIDYQFRIDQLDRSIKMPVKIRQELYFIFKEAVNNIAKHSNATSVEVYLVNNGPDFEMIVHDNGTEQPKVTVKTGQGLANIRMRAQRINARLAITNGNGYTVELRMKKFT